MDAQLALVHYYYNNILKQSLTTSTYVSLCDIEATTNKFSLVMLRS